MSFEYTTGPHRAQPVRTLPEGHLQKRPILRQRQSHLLSVIWRLKCPIFILEGIIIFGRLCTVVCSFGFAMEHEHHRQYITFDWINICSPIQMNDSPAKRNVCCYLHVNEGYFSAKQTKLLRGLHINRLPCKALCISSSCPLCAGFLSIPVQFSYSTCSPADHCISAVYKCRSKNNLMWLLWKTW